MKKNQTETKRAYLKPETTVYMVESENFFCTSVQPDAQNSQEDDWEPDTEIDGGEYEFE